MRKRKNTGRIMLRKFENRDCMEGMKEYPEPISKTAWEDMTNEKKIKECERRKAEYSPSSKEIKKINDQIERLKKK